MHVWAKRGHRVGGKVWAQGGLRQGALESTAAEVGRQEAQCGVLMGLQAWLMGKEGALWPLPDPTPQLVAPTAAIFPSCVHPQYAG